MKSVTKSQQNNKLLYDTDFARWCDETADALHDGRVEDVDHEPLSEEVRDMGKRDRRELHSRMVVLITHLLKWQWQPLKRSNSWLATIGEQRLQILLLLRDSPSLNYMLVNDLPLMYMHAAVKAKREVKNSLFRISGSPPGPCPYDLNQILDSDFLPRGPWSKTRG